MKKIISLLLFISLLISALLLQSCNFASMTLIAENGTSEYIIIRGDESSKTLWKAGGKLQDAINGECGEDTIAYETDFVKRSTPVPTNTKEILIGETNRAESALAFELLPDRKNGDKDYAIAVFGERVAIAAGSDEAYHDAADYFASKYINNGKVKVPSNLSYVYKHGYPELYIGETALSEYTIIYPENNNYLYTRAAKKLNKLIESHVGYGLNVDSDKNTDSYIYTVEIGLEKSEDDTYIISVTEDGTIKISGSPEAVEYAVSDYSTFSKMFDKSFILKKGTTVASENYKETLNALSKKEKSITPISGADFGKRAYAYTIVDDDHTKRGNLTSSWDYDGRGTENFYYYTASANDISEKEPVYVTRQLTKQYAGKVTVEAMVTLSKNHSTIELCNTLGEHAFYIETRDGDLYLLSPDGGLKELCDKGIGSQIIKITADFDAKKLYIYYGNSYIGEYPFSEECTYADMLRFGVTPEGTGSTTPEVVKMYANYLVNERFILLEDTIPCDWETSYEGTQFSAKPNAGMFGGNYDNKSLDILAKSFNLSKNFEKTSGKVVFEGKFMVPERAEGLTFALMSDSVPVASVKTKSFGIFSGSDALLRDYYSEGVWHTLRIEADTVTGKALIKMNGKKLGEIWLEKAVEYFDGVLISFESDKETQIYLDEIYAFASPELEDYPTAPVISDDDEYTVGINICSLWREGTHSGWDKISAYDEIKPHLGYYDEGNPEVMDWEIKWMREHGIDFQLFCWYASSANVPFMHTHLNDALMNGYMNAKYSDMMDFALLWECANAGRPESSEDFRNVYVPYFVEHYLSDERYATIDGNAVLAIFGAGKLIDSLGGTEKCKAEFDYFREICKELGYKGAVIMACSSSTDRGSLKHLKNAGFDAVYAYNWGKSGYSPSYTEDNIRKQISRNVIHVVPTLSTGFNNVGWAGTRSDNMTVENYEKMLRVFRDELLGDYEGTWEKEFIMLSTWNEYGEGTYIMPSGLNGFGYVDAVRRQFGNSTVKEHDDSIPSQKSLDRFSQMYSPERNTLEPLYRYTPELKGELFTEWNFESTPEDALEWNMQFGIADFSNTDGKVSGTGLSDDFAINCTSAHKRNIILDDIQYVRILMKAEKPSTATLFFTTDTSSSWDSAKSLASVSKTGGEYKEYIFDARSCSAWTGKLMELRFDPMTTTGDFEIKSIRFYKTERSKVQINSAPFINNYSYEVEGENVYMAINPQTGIIGKLGAAYRWNKEDKELTLYNSKGSVRLNIGSAKATVNCVDVYGFEKEGSLHKEYEFAKPVTELDGLPVLCMNEIALLLGHTVEVSEDGAGINIITK